MINIVDLRKVPATAKEHVFLAIVTRSHSPQNRLYSSNVSAAKIKFYKLL
jgi:hypothetical protein